MARIRPTLNDAVIEEAAAQSARTVFELVHGLTSASKIAYVSHSVRARTEPVKSGEACWCGFLLAGWPLGAC